MALDLSAEISKEVQKASAPRASRKPVFLFFKDGEKALVRPLFNINGPESEQIIPLMKHYKWSDDRAVRIDAICAAEIGKSCKYCEAAVNDRKLTAYRAYYIPVFVFQVVDKKSGARVTYKDAETGEERPVKGFRVLELSLSGRVRSILTTLNEFFVEDDAHDIRICDFVVAQEGSGTTKDYSVLPKAPKPLEATILSAMPSRATFRQAILDARSPMIAQESAHALTPGVSDAFEEAHLDPEYGDF